MALLLLAGVAVAMNPSTTMGACRIDCRPHVGQADRCGEQPGPISDSHAHANASGLDVSRAHIGQADRRG